MNFGIKIWKDVAKLKIIRSVCGSIRQQHTNSVDTYGFRPDSEIQKELDNLNEEQKKTMKFFRIEHKLLILSGSPVPEQVTDEQWLDILRFCPNEILRYKHLFELHRMEKYEKTLPNQPNKDQNIHSHYTHPYEKEFVDLSTTIRHEEYTDHKLYRAFLEGPTVVIDCSYDNVMSRLQVSKLLSQIRMAHDYNKSHQSTVHMHLCNIQQCSPIEPVLQRMKIAQYYQFSNNSYMDFYPRKRLMYLCNHAQRVLTEYNEDDVYIIGGLTDVSRNSSTKIKVNARRDKLRVARLPMVEHLRWSPSRSGITLDLTLRVLLDVRNHGDWNKAMDVVRENERINKALKQKSGDLVLFS